MSDKENPKIDNTDIGKNTRWDTPEKSPNAGSTVPKPPRSLNPSINPKK